MLFFTKYSRFGLQKEVESLRTELSVPKYMWLLPRALPDLAFVSTSQERFQEDTDTKMCAQAPRWPPKWIPNRYKASLFSEVGHVCKQGAKKHDKGYFPQSLLEDLLSQKSEVISSLNSTCSYLCVYFSRTLPRRHLDTQMCPKAPKWAPKWVQNKCKTWLSIKVGNVCLTH